MSVYSCGSQSFWTEAPFHNFCELSGTQFQKPNNGLQCFHEEGPGSGDVGLSKQGQA